MTRGVLIDVAALKGVAVLPDRYEITVADLPAGPGQAAGDARTR